MIQINELRVGNNVKVTISNDAGIYEVLGIPAWGMNGAGDGKEPVVMIDRCPKQLVAISKLKPIKLTPEILEKCGFHKQNFAWVPEGHEDKYYMKWDFTIWDEGPGDYHYNSAEFPTPLKFLHQLQNLYFSLTDKELNYKP